MLHRIQDGVEAGSGWKGCKMTGSVSYHCVWCILWTEEEAKEICWCNEEVQKEISTEKLKKADRSAGMLRARWQSHWKGLL